MSQRFDKLVALLKELFQLDQPDLDFGIYRIMHAKSAEVSRFLERDLLPQVKAEFATYRPADKAAIEKELAQAIEQAKNLGVDPESTQKVKELRARLEEQAVDIDALEAEVYDHLYRFFRRYYHEGDFISRRVYKEGVYAIPYEGEEVKLYWANHDQYYIKTSEYLRDYAFRLQPDDEKNPMRVHFRLVDAAEGEHGNVKEANKRVFVLTAEDFMAEEDGTEGKELVIRFEYRPATLTDWPEGEREGKKKPPAQKDLLAFAEQRILAVQDAAFAPWIEALRQPHVKSDGSRADYSRLRAHLNRYTARNTFDYFIHKDLGGFLRRELDFYIKNEVMHLDDIENETAPRVEQYLSKIRVIRKIARKIIDFLTQIEDFQKKLWLKKKFVTETFWCVSIGTILKIDDEAAREALLAEIAGNDAQRDEWVRLHAIDEIEGDLVTPGYSTPLTTAFLQAYPTLMVDTRHFDADFTARLLEAIGDVDEQTDGVLFHSENFQALTLMQKRYREEVKCVYIDPPYNTGKDGFPYRDNYQHSCWLEMLSDRLTVARNCMTLDAVLLSSIDDTEQPRLRLLMDEQFGSANHIANVVWKGATDNNPTRIATEHEYVVWYAKEIGATPPVWRSSVVDAKQLMLDEWKRLRDTCKTLKEVQMRFREFVRNNRDVLAPLTHYDRVDEEGPYTGGRKVHNPGKEGYRYDVIHPKTGKPCVQPARGYRFPKETMERLLASGKIIFGEDETQIVQIKEYLRDYTGGLKAVVELDSRVAANSIEALFGSREIFRNPKPVELLSNFFSFITATGSVVLDFFAGSGTTGHAVINLNREDGGRRKFILVEMGDYFDTVLLPRLKKVTFTPEWKNGKPKRLATAEEADRSPRIFKVLRLESYEDTLNNLEIRRSKVQEELFSRPEVQGADGFYEQYLLRYMLDVETRGSASLLNIRAFTDPTRYKLKVKRPGSDESREVCVDLIETFNWLIGLTVRHISAPRRFSAAFKRDPDPDLPEGAPRRLLLDGRLREDPEGPWWFRTVEGETRDGRKTLVIWRNRPGGEDPEGVEQDNLVLDAWFQKQGYSSKDSEFDLIYVNGTNNLENLKAPDDTWKVRLIEEDFHRRMFEMEGA
ncbi:site-specific DNA-methyltransferase [Deferrisoma camini]|uniref:site-specific DNA-methyltransferase n=1 Tax=Deferrisoma camini TaxID=1035120 RepID=UPI00046CA00D|nr:site-specific DNA-methyltransferase [Deferrisoma camini]